MTQDNQPLESLLNNKIVTITIEYEVPGIICSVSLRALSETLLWKIIMHNY